MSEPAFITDEARVKMLLDHLMECHNRFCEAHPEIGPMDDFMAVHNFHAVFVLSLERDYRLPTELQLFVREMATETFRRAMESKPAFRQGKEKPND